MIVKQTTSQVTVNGKGHKRHEVLYEDGRVARWYTVQVNEKHWRELPRSARLVQSRIDSEIAAGRCEVTER